MRLQVSVRANLSRCYNVVAVDGFKILYGNNIVLYLVVEQHVQCLSCMAGYILYKARAAGGFYKLVVVPVSAVVCYFSHLLFVRPLEDRIGAG